MLQSRALSLVLATCAVALGAGRTARAQAIANPNQIRGLFELTNTNPDVLAYLDAPGNLGLASLSATAATPFGYPSYQANTNGVVESRLRGRFELSVETSATGLPYDVRPSAAFAQSGFPVPAQRSAPLHPEPAPDAEMTFSACAGILRVHFRDASGAACIVQNGNVTAFNNEGGAGGSVPPGGADAIVVLRGSALSFAIQITWSTGSDPLHDLVQHVVYVPERVLVGCDEIVDLNVDCQSADAGSGLGRIIGRVDVLGFDERVSGRPPYSCLTGVKGSSSNSGNVRYDCLLTTPSSGPFELENLVPDMLGAFGGGWLVEADVTFIHRNMTASLRWPGQGTSIRADETTDLGDLFVLDPGFLRESVSLLGPPTRSPGFEPFLADLGTALVPFRLWSSGLDVIAPGATRSAEGIAATTAGSGTHDPVRHRFDGLVEIVTGGFFREPSVHAATGTTFTFQQPAGDADPNRHHASSFSVDEPDLAQVLIQPGDTAEFNHAYCTGELRIAVHSTGAPFYKPDVSAAGALMGQDFEGRNVSREQSGAAQGTPVERANAATDGQILMTLPEGEYTFSPSATFVNPGGGLSVTSFRRFDLDVGCRQVLDASPEIQISVTPPPGCAADLVRIEGRANSVSGIASLSCEIRGGVTTEICQDCGTERDFSIDVALPDADAEIIVRAVDSSGQEAMASSFTRFAREPSAGDLRIGAAPLTLALVGGRLRLQWEDVGGEASVYRGSLDSLWRSRRYDHRESGACSIANTSVDLTLPIESSYFLIGAHCEWGDTALGRDSVGRRIPGASPRCP